MNRYWKNWMIAGLTAVTLCGADELKYQNDFEQAATGDVPEDFLVLEGQFAVREDGGNKFLELPGAPLDTFGVLFGPSGKEDVGVSARFFGTAKGRRFPTFAIGINGVGGYKLWVAPGKKSLELQKGDSLKATEPLEWTPGKWTLLKLQVIKLGEKEWKVEGKCWQEGEPEPKEPSITYTETQSLPGGRASVYGSPFSGTPIRYDDLKVWTLKK